MDLEKVADTEKGSARGIPALRCLSCAGKKQPRLPVTSNNITLKYNFVTKFSKLIKTINTF